MKETTAKLQVGDHAYDLLTDTVTIGRGGDNQIVVDDASVSGHHAEVFIREGQHFLRDLGSTNGTKVNGQPITETALNSSDVICFGSVEARLTIEATPPKAALNKQGLLSQEIDALNQQAHAVTRMPWLFVGIAGMLLLLGTVYIFRAKEDPYALSQQTLANTSVATPRQVDVIHKRIGDAQNETSRKTAEGKSISAKKADEQQKLMLVAEKLFTAVSLNPNVTIAPSLVKSGASVEIKGEPLQAITDLIQNRNWLGLYNYGEGGGHSTELPEESSIREIARQLAAVSLNLVLKTPYKPEQNGDRLTVLYVWTTKVGGLRFDYSASHEHPDKNGFICEWSPQQANVFIFIGNINTRRKITEFNNEYSKQLENVNTKLNLTEISKSEHDATLVDIDKTLLARLAKWVGGQTQTTDIQDQPRIR